MDEQRFIYDSTNSPLAVKRAAEAARERSDVTVVDVTDEHDPRDLVDAYRGLLAGTAGPVERKLGTIADVDPADGVFVGDVAGERTVLVGEEALEAIA